MHEGNKIKHQKVNLEMMNTTGIKAKDAVKIDAALSTMKWAGKDSLSSSIQKATQTESRSVLEYEIDSEQFGEYLPLKRSKEIRTKARTLRTKLMPAFLKFQNPMNPARRTLQAKVI